MALANQANDAANQDGGFAGASACDDKHRTVHMFDGLRLTLVRLKGTYCSRRFRGH
jgi:hypothetical protein